MTTQDRNGQGNGNGEGHGRLPAEILAAAASADRGRVRAAVERLARMFERDDVAQAVPILEASTIELARGRLLDDVRRALPGALEARLGALVREHCSPCARAAWKLAIYDLPPVLPPEPPASELA